MESTGTTELLFETQSRRASNQLPFSVAWRSENEILEVAQ